MKHFGLIFALAAGALFTACSEDDVISTKYDKLDPVVQQNVQKFGTKSSEMKVLIGKKDFTNTVVTRGADVNANMWPSVPVIPTSDEVNGVLEYIKTNPGGVEWPGWTYYYVQHVGGAHNKYSYKDRNGAMHDNIDGTSSMETLQILENSGNWQHVYNFNAGKCDNAATGNATLMTDGFKDAKTLNEYSSSTISHWRLFKWNGNYYLGFDFSLKKNDGEVPGDGIYDDWVMKIIPGAGEVIPEDPTDPGTDPGVDPGTDPGTDPGVDPEDPDELPKEAHVEFDIHQQEHKDWHEIKTSIHLRDTVNVRAFLPIPQEYQAVADDFDIRNGADYFYITEIETTQFQIADKTFSVEVEINHKADGIEFLINGSQCAEALRYARGIYGDGLTFEFHSYANPNVTNEQLWAALKETKCVETNTTDWKQWTDGFDISTLTFGQVTSAFYTNWETEEEYYKYNERP